jgi:actin-related protein
MAAQPPVQPAGQAPSGIADGTPIIIDIGESSCKVGFAGDEAPRAKFPSLVGREKYAAVMVDARTKKVYVGEECEHMRGVLKINYPMQRGNIMNWEDFFEILTHIFYTVLRIDPAKHPIIYIEHLLTPQETREYVARVLFQTYNVPALFMVPSSVLAMFSVGLTNGFVIDSGEGITYLAPVFNGEPFFPAISKIPLAGADVAENLKGLLLRRGYSLQSSAQKEIARDIKEKNCYLAIDPVTEKSKTNPKDLNQYTLPDGELIKLDPETRFSAAEILFNPGILGYNCESIPQAIINCLTRLDTYWRWELLKNLVLAGGNTNIKGFEIRLEKELEKMLAYLGPMPASAPEPKVEQPQKKLVDVTAPQKVKDTCPKCGVEVNPAADEFCPNCGNGLRGTQISVTQVTGGTKSKGPLTDCPKCKKKLPKDTEGFCPFCGTDLGRAQKLTEKPKLGVIQMGPPTEMQSKLSPALTTKAGPNLKEPTEFDNASEFEEAKTTSVIKFHGIEDRSLAAFKGAAILGSLPTFQQLLIKRAEFDANPTVINRTISQILGP